MQPINCFDIDTPSKISKERRLQLNQMAKQAFVNTGRAQGNDHVCDLKLECFALNEIFEEVSGIGSYVDFYLDINRAFELLLKEKPKAFRTYAELTTMLRIFSKHNDVSDVKWTENRRVLNDLDVLETESFDIKEKVSHA